MTSSFPQSIQPLVSDRPSKSLLRTGSRDAKLSLKDRGPTDDETWLTPDPRTFQSRQSPKASTLPLPSPENECKRFAFRMPDLPLAPAPVTWTMKLLSVQSVNLKGGKSQLFAVAWRQVSGGD